MINEAALRNSSLSAGPSAQQAIVATPALGSLYFDQHTIATLPSPWAMAFLPDGRLLVTERPAPGMQVNPTAPGNVRLVTSTGEVSAPVTGLPGNVGILDVVLDPNFAQNHIVYFSFLDRDPTAARVGRNAADMRVDPVGLAVVRAVIDLDAAGGPALTSSSVIWHQFPHIVSHPGSGEPGGRLAFSPDGTYLFIAAGDRQEFGPVQALDNTLGKIVRIFPDGTIPTDNPFVGVAGALPEIWSLGLRNPYGLLFDSDGLLWEHEMGPSGGDELNVIQRGANYGWPYVSYGNNYDGSLIPKPATGDGYAPSPLFWTPVIAPSGMMSYSGSAFPQWTGNLIISGLQSKGLVIVDSDGTAAIEVGRIDLGVRVREVEQGPDGALWILTDQASGGLIRLAPRTQIGNDGDFNGDGRSDVLWRSNTGQVGDWQGNAAGGFFINDGSSLRSVSVDWHVAGRGDYNGDGRDDVLWRNDNGTVGTWSGSATGGFIVRDGAALRSVSSDWIIVGNDDFNGDGRDDVLWRNSSGTVGTWLGQSDGTFSVNDGAALRAVPRDWHVVATGDFNGDGAADILWRSNSGALGTWSGSASGNFAINDGAALLSVTRDWLVEASGDFNGDGRADILWRNINGTVGDWLGNADGSFAINGTSVLGAPLDWHVDAIGDYNGDGRDDILWRHDSGTVSNWLGNGDGSFTPNDSNILVSVSEQWRVQSDVFFV